MRQEHIIKIQLIEQEASQLNEQLKLIELNISELNELNSSLNELEVSKEILANLGKKIYLPVQIKDDKLIIDVGKGNFVKKNISDTIKIIENQIENLANAKYQIYQRLENLQKEMDNLAVEIGKEESGKMKK